MQREKGAAGASDGPGADCGTCAIGPAGCAPEGTSALPGCPGRGGWRVRSSQLGGSALQCRPSCGPAAAPAVARSCALFPLSSPWVIPGLGGSCGRPGGCGGPCPDRRAFQAAPLSAASDAAPGEGRPGPLPRPPTRKQLGMEKGVALSPSPKGLGSFLLFSDPWAIGIRSRVLPGPHLPSPALALGPALPPPHPHSSSRARDPPREPPGMPRGCAGRVHLPRRGACSRWHGRASVPPPPTPQFPPAPQIPREHPFLWK